MTKAEVVALLKEHGSMRKVAKITGIHRETLKRICEGKPIKPLRKNRNPLSSVPRSPCVSCRIFGMLTT